MSPGAAVSRGPAGRLAAQRSSILASRQYASATAQTATNSPAMQIPARLMLKFPTVDQNAPCSQQLGAEHPEDLDAADYEGCPDGQAGDDEVVVDLADWPGECPAVGEVHKTAVQAVEQHQPAGEKERQRQHGVERQALEGSVGGGREQDDLGPAGQGDRGYSLS